MKVVGKAPRSRVLFASLDIGECFKEGVAEVWYYLKVPPVVGTGDVSVGASKYEYNCFNLSKVRFEFVAAGELVEPCNLEVHEV